MKKIHIDPMNIMFAKVIKICTLVSIVIMIFFGSLYLAGIKPYLDPSLVVEHWGKPVSRFWKETKGIEINDYSWFLAHVNCMDSLSMIGISLLCLTPLLGIIIIMPRARKVYALLFFILIAELIFSIIRPFI